jgi:MYXO-CTERM domain-containing protein
MKDRMPNQWLSRAVGLSAFFACGLLASFAHAEQVVVAEAAYTHSAQTTKDSHFHVPPTPETPANWASPVDYAHGSVHVRLEVKTKPSATPTRYQICFEMKVNYCCTDQAPAYTAPGVYEWDTEVEKLWRPGPVDFTQGIVQNALILKDTNNVKPAPENVGEATSALYMPSDVAVTVTLVSSGSTFQPPDVPDPSTGGSGGASQAGSGGLSAGSGGDATAGTNGSAGTASAPNGGNAPIVTQPLPSGGMASSDGGVAGSGTPPTMATLPADNDEASCRVGAPGADSSGASWFTAVGALGVAALRSRRRRRER